MFSVNFEAVSQSKIKKNINGVAKTHCMLSFLSGG